MQVIDFLLSFFASDLAPWVAGIAGVLSALLMARQSGRSAERAKVDRARIEAADHARQTERDADAKTDAEIDREADRWTRG